MRKVLPKREVAAIISELRRLRLELPDDEFEKEIFEVIQILIRSRFA
jgi:hypothetical protein